MLQSCNHTCSIGVSQYENTYAYTSKLLFLLAEIVKFVKNINDNFTNFFFRGLSVL